MNITYDNVSLTTSPYIVEKIQHKGVTQRELFTYGLARQRGASILNAEYKAKSFKLNGFIVASSQADLDAKIDELAELLARRNKNLDIDHNGGTRRYVATVASVTMPSEHYHISYIPFEVLFIVPSGVGTDSTETVQTTAGITNLINTNTLSVVGSATPKMRTQLTLTAENGCTKLEFLCNGDKLTIDATFASGDVIIIDEANLKVTINGIEQPYTGIFPQFGLGANVYSLQFTGTSVEYTSSFSYLKTYL